ncbi:hypothetical protein EYF80_019220 [Liparis tanakae]|uniref:Secreted protein n=1 Tax=Liparis tanakae TaxID=230148 RepID=A0A4Z2HYT0_9TELE|nr:hypothetical protein EYF80_019220 [Liparis tanakae]
MISLLLVTIGCDLTCSPTLPSAGERGLRSRQPARGKRKTETVPPPPRLGDERETHASRLPADVPLLAPEETLVRRLVPGLKAGGEKGGCQRVGAAGTRRRDGQAGGD